ncbi:hypothetical protein BT93_A2138 [Corymbia citriodora subsp. variegata]|nr:hypothetical protein BT93_A2138 [Corymbia citriodora subsp. variegata]
MPQVIIEVGWSNEKSKKKAIKIVSKNQDVESFSVDDDNKRLTLIGEMDPVTLVKKMRRDFSKVEIVAMNQRVPEAPPQEPQPSYGHPYYPNPQPSAPPYWAGDGYHHPQFYPAYGHLQYPNLSNWGPPSPPPPYRGYNGY